MSYNVEDEGGVCRDSFRLESSLFIESGSLVQPSLLLEFEDRLYGKLMWRLWLQGIASGCYLDQLCREPKWESAS